MSELEKIIKEVDNEVKKSVKAGFDSLAENVIAIIVLVLPVLFLPQSWLPFGLSKVILFASLAIVPIILWSISRIKNRTLVFPTHAIFWGVLALPGAYLISALLSNNIGHSLVGSGLDSDTVLFVTLGAVISVGVGLLFGSINSILRLFLSLQVGFSVMAIAQLARVFFGGSFISSMFGTSVTNSILGSWNDIAVFAGLILIMSIITFAYKLKGTLKIVAGINTVLALTLLIFTNLSTAWIAILLFSIVFAIYMMTNVHIDRKDYLSWSPLAATFLISLFFVFSGTAVSSYLNKTFNISYVDVRPSWGGTMEVAKATYKDNWLLGSGPNTFSDSWVKYKPVGINETAFWNTDFNAGIGFIPTTFVTTGILGGLAWLLLMLGILYHAFRVLWVKIRSQMTQFATVASAFAAVYSVLILVVYVPQTALFGILFLIIGLFVALLRISRVAQVLEVNTREANIGNFVFTLVLLSVFAVSVFSAWAVTEKTIVTVLLQGAGKAVQEKDVDKAMQLTSRATSIARRGVGDYEQVLIASSQLATINLNNVLSDKAEMTEEVKAEKLKNALKPVILPLQEAIISSPSNYKNYLYLGNVYERLASIVSGADKAALQNYDKALNLNPNNPEILLRKARLALATKDVKGEKSGKDIAKEYIEQALKMKRNYIKNL